MNREEAIRRICVHNRIHSMREPTAILITEALDMAIEALRGPWVKTADRLPNEADAGYDDEILTLYQDGEKMMLGFDYWQYVAKHPEQYLYFMPIPPLPEVEG